MALVQGFTVRWALVLLAVVFMVATHFSTPARCEEMKELRKQAASRTRRIIFNNDGDDSWKPTTRQEFLDLRTTPLLGTHVDTIFYSTTQSFAYFSHNSRACEVNAPEGTMAARFIAQGTDNLEVMIDFCRQNGIEIFWSMRMNDTHDYSNVKFRSQWKLDHPEYLIGTEDNEPRCRTWTSADFGHQEVRDKAFAIIEDVCERYDVDGIELDFFRHLCFFKGPAFSGEASDEDRGLMTELLQRVRAMCDQVGQERGRPILIAVRVPDAVGYCRAVGIDLQLWLEEGLFDILIPTGYMKLSPWQDTVELGHKYGVPVYPCLSDSRVKGEAGKARNVLEAYRARAMNVHNSGADGVYIFNVFNPRHPLWSELGEPQTLRGLAKHYYVNYRGIQHANNYLLDGERFLLVPTLDPQHPVSLQAGDEQATSIAVGDDVLWGKDQGIVPEIILRLQVTGLAGADDMLVKFNGEALAGGAIADGWLEFAAAPELVKQGENSVEMALAAGAKHEAVVHDLQMVISYEKQ